MDKRYWRITGFSGLDQIFERIVPEDALADAQVRLLLQCLLAREIDIDTLIDGTGIGDLASGAEMLVVESSETPVTGYRISGAALSFEATMMSEARPLTTTFPYFGPDVAA